MGLSPTGLGSRFWLLIGAIFLGFLGMGTVLPALAPHVHHDLGGSDQTIGLVIGVFSFVALASRFFSGPLADRRGRKTAFLTGLASCALAGAVYLLPLGIAGIHRSGQALGLVSSGIWGGISAGPVVGQWLGSFERAALMQTVAALAAAAILTRVSEEYHPASHPRRRHWIPASIIAPGLAIGFVNVHYPVVVGFLILHLARYGKAGPAALTAYALLILLSRFFLGGLPDRFHPAISYYVGLAAMAAGLMVIGAGPGPVAAVAAAAALGFGFSFPWASVASTVLRQTPAGERGSALGVLTAFCDLFVGVSSFAAGAVAARFGYAATFLCAAGALVAAAVVGRFVFASGSRPRTQAIEDECESLAEGAVCGSEADA